MILKDLVETPVKFACGCEQHYYFKEKEAADLKEILESQNCWRCEANKIMLEGVTK